MFLNIWTSGPHLWSPARRPLPLGFHCSPDLCDFTLYWPSQQTSWRHAKRCRPTGVTHLTTFVIFVRCSCSIKELKKKPSQESLWCKQFYYGLCSYFLPLASYHPTPPSPGSDSHWNGLQNSSLFWLGPSEWSRTTVFTNGISINISISVHSGHLKISHQDLHHLF